MKILKIHKHPDILNLDGKTMFTRLSTRAIALQGESILLLHTKRYDDYSLPGGGLDEGEDPALGMARELNEETGAQNIKNIEESVLRSDLVIGAVLVAGRKHMISYCYSCTVDFELGETKYEDYELKNGMAPKWVNIYDAIKHNEHTIKHSPKKGMSIERETFLLKLISQKL